MVRPMIERCIEVQSARAQITAIPFVATDLCQRCAQCSSRLVCRSKALIRIDPEDPPFVDTSRCYGCNVCIPACPFGALRLND
jgi:MinD superfamily P-loop ATPase